MKLTKYLSQRDTELAKAADSATTTIAGAPAVFGLTTTEANGLATRAAAFSAKLDEMKAAKLAYETLIEEKDIARAQLRSQFQSYMAQAYASLTVSDPAFVSIGLDPREPKQSRPVRIPLNFTVEPFSNGTIVAKWKRNQNTSYTTFRLQQLSEDGVWEEIWSGATLRVELSGFTPGVEQSFRVVAAKGEETSLPSNEAQIYPRNGEEGLRVAA